jgi:hypothetical protein
VTSPGLKTRESVNQTVLEAGGFAQNSTVRERRWPVVAVKVLLAGYTSGRPESRPKPASILSQGHRLILKLIVLHFRNVGAFSQCHLVGYAGMSNATEISFCSERYSSATHDVGVVHTD